MPIKQGESAINRSTLKRGAKGPEVAELQRQLGMPREQITAAFTDSTVNAVLEFQKHHGLAETGEVDIATNAKLFPESEAEELMKFREDE